jgi:hypothetical protein
MGKIADRLAALEALQPDGKEEWIARQLGYERVIVIFEEAARAAAHQGDTDAARQFRAWLADVEADGGRSWQA